MPDNSACQVTKAAKRIPWVPRASARNPPRPGPARAAGGAATFLAQAVITLLPFLESFNINAKLSHTILAPTDLGGPGGAEWIAVWTYVGWAAAYATAYAAAAIGLAVLLFRRRSLA